MYGESATPWLIFRGDNRWETVPDIDSYKSTKDIKTLYVITKLKKIANLKTMLVAGCGTWDGQTGKTYIEMNNNKIGYKKMFDFRASKKMAGTANKSSECCDVSSRDVGCGGSIHKAGNYNNKRKYSEMSFDDDPLEENKQLSKNQRVMEEATIQDNQELMKEELFLKCLFPLYQAASGAMQCQMMNMTYLGVVPMHKHIEVNRLIKGRLLVNLEFLQRLKRDCDCINGGIMNENYNPVERRSKGGKEGNSKGLQKNLKSLQTNNSHNPGTGDRAINKISWPKQRRAVIQALRKESVLVEAQEIACQAVNADDEAELDNDDHDETTN
ncbi:hypothetical protein M9H77_04929 [Catharanthus roseus]|uniref:Uncharacterized protein n=1 Tax=Catharanthus roseus TaxID=4058 RepID=A0ACC0CFL8_CATRO|nr:hypothetical protein M9H77_04929 [Catharanthus roseus]